MTTYLAEIQFWDTFVNTAFIMGMTGAFIFWALLRGRGSKDYYGIPLWLILLGAALVRAPLLFDAPWYDETFTYAMTLPSNEDFLTALLSDVHPPLHYLLMREVAFFSDSIIAFRLPSLIAGLALIVMIYHLTMRLSKHQGMAQFAAILAAFLPSLIYYSTEARYPIFLALAVVCAFYAILKASKLGLLIASFLAVGLHSTGLIYAYALFAVALFYHRRAWLFTVAYGAIFSLYWLPFMMIQAKDVSNGFWLLEQSPVFHLVSMMFMFAGDNIGMIFFGASFGILLLGMGLMQAMKNKAWAWGAIALGVPLLLWTISIVWQPVYLPRALLGSVTLFIPYVSIAIFQMKYRKLMIVLFVFIASYSIYSQWHNGRGWREAEILENCENSDSVFAMQTFLAVMARYYTDSPVIAWNESNNPQQELSPEAIEAMGIRRAQNIEGMTGRVCVIYQLNRHTDILEMTMITAFQRYMPETISLKEPHHLFNYFVLIITMPRIP